MKPADMIKAVVAIKRKNIWDVGGMGGLLKGELFEDLVEKHLPAKTFEECPIPLGISTFDVYNFKTHYFTKGSVAVAARTSCTFPGMFQPVFIDGAAHIDGGVFDTVGLLALPHALGLATSDSVARRHGKHHHHHHHHHHHSHKDQHHSGAQTSDDAATSAPTQPAVSAPTLAPTPTTSSSSSSSSSSSTAPSTAPAPAAAITSSTSSSGDPPTAHLVVNIVFGRSSVELSVLPKELTRHKLLTIVLENIPMVHPLNMDTEGVVAFK
jgi:predicted acylesterase/phospholipase RssA